MRVLFFGEIISRHDIARPSITPCTYRNPTVKIKKNVAVTFRCHELLKQVLPNYCGNM